ncbi:HelD family protein [Microbispora rosea]
MIEHEQRAVDHAYDCAEQDLQAIAYFGGGNTTDCPDAGLAPHPDLPPEYGRREDLGDLPLVIMRVDLAEDLDDKLTWYLGRRTVRDRQGDLIVVKWTVPAAVKWRLATPDKPGEVRLRRSLKCEERKVLDYRDEFVHERTPDAPSVSADVIGVETEETADPFLLADLNLARDGVMRDIVETIQRDQLRLVSDDRPGLLVIQGGPGTGKTAVGLHRVTWLLDNRHFTPDEVLVVGPHAGFLRYVGQVLPRLGSQGVRTVDATRLWGVEIRGVDAPSGREVKSDERMAQVLHRAVEELINVETLDGSPGHLQLSFRGASLRIPHQEVAGLASESRDAGGPYLVRRRRFVDRLLDRLLRDYLAMTRTRSADDKFRVQLEKQPQVAALLNTVWPAVSAERVLRDLLGDTERLRQASAGLLTTDEQAAIARPRARRIGEEPWTIDDLVCLEELRHILSGDEPDRYRHIVLDEAQDLTPMQARSLARRCPSGSMTVLGDLAQATGARQHDVWGRLAGILAGGEAWHIAELTTGYRVPTEVMEFAAPLASRISPSTAFPWSVRPPAEDSVTVLRVMRDDLVTAAINRARELAAADEEQARSIAVIAADEESVLRLSAALPEGEGQTLVLTAPMAKGLEFDHVIVVEPASIAKQDDAAGLRRLYVAITRCTQTLTIVHSAPLPPVLGGPEDETGATEESDSPTATPAIMAAAPPRYDGYEHFLAALEGAVTAERREFDHERLRHMLIADLYGARCQPNGDSPLADVTCSLPDGLAVYEVIGEGVAGYVEMRDAAVRLLEIDGARSERADQRFLVLPQAPEDRWALDLLDKTLNVAVIWRGASGWEGPKAALALGGSLPRREV